MAAAFQPPSSAYGPYAILKNVCANSTNRYSTSDFLWRWTHDVDEDCRIEKMTLLKCKKNEQHEFVAVSVIIPSKLPSRYPDLNITIFFERTMGHACGKDLEQGEFDDEESPKRRSGDYASAALPRPMLKIASSSMDIPESKAKDIVIIPSGDEWRSLGLERAFEIAFKDARRRGNIYNDIDIDYTITFPEKTRPSIIDLAVLLNQVSETHRDYRVFRSQCYFYAALVCETMRELFQGQGQKALGSGVEEREISGSDEMNFSRVDVQSDAEPAEGTGNVSRRTGSKSVAGKYGMFSIVNYTSPRFQKEVESMCESFPRQRQAKIDDLKKNQMAELLQAQEEIANERQGRLEERREREAVQKRLEEEQRKSEELLRQLTALKTQHSSGPHLPSAVVV